MVKECKRHGLVEHFLGTNNYLSCKKCRSERVARRRRKVKEILVNEAGGACIRCGYSKCVKALDFHHRDKTSKSFGLAQGGKTIGIDKMRIEAAKCDLVCANCHREIEEEEILNSVL